jgi:hypothetical protein
MRKGWFHIPGVQDGDRTLADQIKGLEPLFAEVQGKAVLDLGCAEGLIARACAVAGALRVHGFDWLAPSIAAGRQYCSPWPVVLEQGDLNESALLRRIGCMECDVVLLLAILHKLREPGLLLRTVARRKPELVVVRLPPATAPVIVDARSGNRPCNVQVNLETHGYTLEQVTKGHFDEWCGYFRRAA